jgi:hypothetical protein
MSISQMDNTYRLFAKSVSIYLRNFLCPPQTLSDYFVKLISQLLDIFKHRGATIHLPIFLSYLD